MPPEHSSVLEAARQHELDILERQVGRSARGEEIIYRGDLEVFDGVVDGTTKHLPRERVLARLTTPPIASRQGLGEVLLQIVSPEKGQWLSVRQGLVGGDATRITRLQSLRGTEGLSAECRDCLGDLSEQPDTLSFDRTLAEGRLLDADGTRFFVRLSGRLERVPHYELDLETIEPFMTVSLAAFLEGRAGPFERVKGEGVRRIEGEIRELTRPLKGAPPQTVCKRVTSYSGDHFVNLEDLSRFGVRSLKVTGSEVCCLDHASHGEAEECVEEVRP